jgi:alkyl hydroperoxide reductase subunit AhpC
MIGVGGDADGQAIREFVSRNQMEWPQFWDQGRRLSQLYDVRSWPTYIVIDDEGIVRFRVTGPTQPVVARLEDEVRRALKAAASRLKQ